MQTVLSNLGPVVGIDISVSMLAARRNRADFAAPENTGIRGSARQLPLRDGSFDLVVSCRLLHHLALPAERVQVLAELLRVSNGVVLASFWDANSWHAWRRKHGLRRARHPDGRCAVPRQGLAQEFEAAGGRVLGFAHSLRWISPQSWIAVEASS